MMRRLVLLGLLATNALGVAEGRADEGSTPSRLATPHIQDSSPAPQYGCLICHADKRRAFLQGVHSERGVRCHECHGGDPGSFEAADAHAGDFRGALDKLEAVEVCASCHSDPDQMRQFGLPADQIAELWTSRHGQLLLGEGDLNAPACSDCHDPHTTRRADDARSGVHPLNIAQTCARCHEDEALMAPYGIPTGQVEQHRRSAHGVALYRNQNFAAPTCIGCHGSHAALPPAVSEISNVCGRCHVNVRRAFDAGPHGAEGGSPAALGCTACHSNHDTERVPADRISETCGDCHAEGSAEITLGIEVEQLLLRAREEIDRAGEAILELQRGGHEVSDEHFRQQAALTNFRKLETVQHSLHPEQMEDLERLIASASLDIRATAEASAEERWEHKLFLVPVWFFALGIVFLAGYRLRQMGHGAEPSGDSNGG